MILARCPACSTTFRVRPEQLSARQGRVRCGQCNHAFNALESVVDESPLADATPAPVILPTGIETSLFVLEEKLPDEEVPPPVEATVSDDYTWPPEIDAPAEATEPAAPLAIDIPPLPPVDTEFPNEPPTFLLQEDTEPEFREEPAFAAHQDDAEWLEPTGEIGAEAAQEWPPADTEAEDIFAPAMEFPLPDDETPRAIEEVPAPQPFETAPPLPDTHQGPVDFDALIHTRDVTQPLISPLARPHRSDEPALPIEEEPEEDPADAPAVSEESGVSPALRQAAWSAGATLLFLALLAQGVLVLRDEIVQSTPQMRPFMESLCAGLGCELPLPRDPAAIAIESSDIQPDAGREAFFTLHATLRNRAEFQQAWPHLEITLTDARDKALVRRVLEPIQWLPTDAPRDAFPARREVVTRVTFEAPGVAAAGYRVYAFYP
ncbi:DUF3426 domain-containing protein [Zoogloea oleivorans]|uniref:DUF3426 domain-containing protein n=1 Tax=Zoogloea oleivorans TaxID=1552750 RepID=A0A6C2D295_9RHOO|nr:zinc-ribbon and DUF3426 domain-containing protein [Zoogloea oleivorans]TYC60161.1 DUF3426 domain-containing protein [Zoogloea oleivorans]